jgi:signal transduction histidine kinase
MVEELEKIDAGLTRMSTLISELLDVANLQIGRPLALNRSETDLVELVREVISDHQHVSERHHIELSTTVSSVRGMWDATRLERVLANLLSNAVKYSPHGGDISITVDSDGDWAVLSVADRGIGIPVTDLPHVFDRFRRGENAAGKIPGTGIGLAAVRDIVEQHGGSISAANREDGGAVFTIRLPRSEEES